MAKDTKKEKEETIQETEQEVAVVSEVAEIPEVPETTEVSDDIKDEIQEKTVEASTEEPTTENPENTETIKPFESYDTLEKGEPITDGPITVQSVKFTSFEDANQAQGESNKNLDILMDIKLQLTVELGRTELPIKKVLELTRGSIIELEKVAGEPVELYANGKLVAHGEVVVIEDNFGLRITSITDPEERLKGM